MANNLQQLLQSINPFKSRTGIDPVKNLSGIISPVQLMRTRQDVLSWREAIVEAENAWYPHRVKMQKLYIDTILNGHVAACVERRKDLTLLRKFEILDAKGAMDDMAVLNFCDVTEKGNDKSLTPKMWLTKFISYALDATYFGYSLISLGDIESDEFNNLSIIKRWNVSPDREIVNSLVYSLSGYKYKEDPYQDWHIYIGTTNDIGTSPSGYGLLYKVGIYEIFLRNLLGYNGDFVEMYAQPYRVGKTMKTSEAERSEFEDALRSMGSAGYAIIEPTDQIDFLETALGGTGYKGYDNLEVRCEKKISKLILGHADAMDSVPGKLGANNGLENPTVQALNDKQSKDGVFIENIINKELIPRMIQLGFNVPEGTTFSYKNDSEQAEIRAKEDESNLKTAQIAQTMKSAGLQMDASYFETRTGIISTTTPMPAPPVFKPGNENVVEKLKNLYK